MVSCRIAIVLELHTIKGHPLFKNVGIESIAKVPSDVSVRLQPLKGVAYRTFFILVKNLVPRYSLVTALFLKTFTARLLDGSTSRSLQNNL